MNLGDYFKTLGLHMVIGPYVVNYFLLAVKIVKGIGLVCVRRRFPYIEKAGALHDLIDVRARREVEIAGDQHRQRCVFRCRFYNELCPFNLGCAADMV